MSAGAAAKETPAFPGSVAPARKGVYKRSIQGITPDLPFSHWDGKRWHVQAADAATAKEAPISGYQTDRMAAHFTWRGLAKKP